MAIIAVATLIKDSNASDMIADELVVYHAHIFNAVSNIPTIKETIAALDLVPDGFKRVFFPN